MSKTHYRKVFKSDHLGIADLEDLQEAGTRLIFTISHVTQHILTSEKNSGVIVAGKKISANIAHFKEPIKPLVLNATNSKIVRKFNNNSAFVEDWSNTLIELYIDPSVKMKGAVVGGVRINQIQPTITKPDLVEGSEPWARAINHFKENNSLELVKMHYSISSENEQKIKDAAKIS